MKLCRHCEVELEEDARYCPLCRNPVQTDMADEKGAPSVPSGRPREANLRIRRWLLEVFSLLAMTSALVILVADFAPDLALSWGLYPLAAIAFLWLFSALAMFCSHRAWLFLPAEVAAACLFLLALDQLTEGPAWFLPLALPVTLLIGTVLALTLIFARKAKLSPFAAIATVMVAAGVFAVGLELLLNRYLDHRWFVSWSAVAFVCMLPLVVLLLYLRGWLRARQGEIRKLFHI